MRYSLQQKRADIPVLKSRLKAKSISKDNQYKMITGKTI